MTRKLATVTLIFLLCAVIGLPLANAQEATGDQVTQADLAIILVRVLGLARFLPASYTALEATEMLMDNKVSPQDGWQLGKIVNRADLARVIVQAMGDAGEIQNPDDPREYVAYLRSIGVAIGTIGEAADSLEPLVEPVAQNVFVVSTTTDPLEKRKTSEPDETEYGTDVEFVASMRPISFPVTLPEVEAAIVEVESRKKKKKKDPVTPD